MFYLSVENDEFSLDDAIECIGFGFYQVRLISIVGLSWVRCFSYKYIVFVLCLE